MDCLLFVLGQKAVFALDLWCVLLRRGFSFGANGFVHDFFQRRECSVSGARFRALLASLFFSRLHLAAVCWVLLPDLVSRPVSTLSGLALVVRYWKATLSDLRRR